MNLPSSFAYDASATGGVAEVVGLPATAPPAAATPPQRFSPQLSQQQQHQQHQQPGALPAPLPGARTALPGARPAMALPGAEQPIEPLPLTHPAPDTDP